MQDAIVLLARREGVVAPAPSSFTATTFAGLYSPVSSPLKQ
jgi:hypothetical protein